MRVPFTNTTVTNIINFEHNSTSIEPSVVVVPTQGVMTGSSPAQPEEPQNAGVALAPPAEQHSEKDTCMSDTSFKTTLNNVTDEIARRTY